MTFGRVRTSSPKVVDRGFVELGKKQMEFTRQGSAS
jgi:hypothetical protein